MTISRIQHTMLNALSGNRLAAWRSQEVAASFRVDKTRAPAVFSIAAGNAQVRRSRRAVFSNELQSTSLCGGTFLPPRAHGRVRDTAQRPGSSWARPAPHRETSFHQNQSLYEETLAMERKMLRH